MERFYLKSGTSVPSQASSEMVEVTAADSLTSRFFAEEAPVKRSLENTNVFQRLHQDSQTRLKVRDARPAALPTKRPDRSGPPIEELLLRRHLESQLRMERLKAQRDEELMKEVQPAPRINDYSRTLAEKRGASANHSRCSVYETTPAQNPINRSASRCGTVQSRRSPTIDASVISSHLSKYSDLILPDDWLPSVGKDDRGEDEETPLELAEQPDTAQPPPLPDTTPKRREIDLAELMDTAEPMEIPETHTPLRTVVDSTVSRERAIEYQKMVKRHLELINQKH